VNVQTTIRLKASKALGVRVLAWSKVYRPALAQAIERQRVRFDVPGLLCQFSPEVPEHEAVDLRAQLGEAFACCGAPGHRWGTKEGAPASTAGAPRGESG